MVLQCKESGDYKPHPEGIHPAVCVDVMDLGLVETDYQGQRRMVNKVKVVFESEQRTQEGKPCTVAKSFTASLHPKAKLSEFLGKWRGRPLVPGENIELDKLIGASCTLVISHQQNMVGKTYASIDAVSKPTKKVTPSGTYDAALARQRYAEWVAKQTAQGRPMVPPTLTSSNGTPRNQVPAAAAPVVAQTTEVPSKSAAPCPSRTGQNDFDPEVGF
jgi:hypothetical protein